jgi:stage V sporulation protein SpoVS
MLECSSCSADSEQLTGAAAAAAAPASRSSAAIVAVGTSAVQQCIRSRHAHAMPYAATCFSEL